MTSDHDRLTDVFLAHAGWAGAQRRALAGDASARQYERLTDGPDGARAILMKDPEDIGSVIAFQRIARHLSALGLSAPRILAALPKNGLLVEEDLGDALFSRVLADQPALEAELYLAAVDALITLHADPAPDAPPYDTPALVAAIDPALDWYGQNATGQADPAGGALIKACLKDALSTLAPWQPVLALRDFHAENLFWLPERSGPARVGLIDFQDAVLTHPVYDLISLAHDVRRPVAPATIAAMFERYASATGQSLEALQEAGAVLSAQRNLRILGIFTRLSLHFAKPDYIDLLPRCWSLLTEALTHPALAALSEAVTATLPAPTPDLLTRLKEQCGTHPDH